MKIDQLAVLAGHTQRLKAASAAMTACNASLQEQDQSFLFANQGFGGHDAIHIKQALMTALSDIAEAARGHLINAGIEFPHPDDIALPTSKAFRPFKPDAKGGVI